MAENLNVLLCLIRGTSPTIELELHRGVCSKRQRLVVDVWNSLSNDIIYAPSNNIKKNRIDKNWVKIWASYKRLISSLTNAHYL